MNYAIKRASQALLTVFVVVNATFFLVRLLPGGPMSYIRAQAAQQAAQESGGEVTAQARLVELYINMNPEEPLWVQWMSYITSAVQGDLGISIWYGEPVTSILLSALPWTLFVMSISIIGIYAIVFLLGATLAYFEGGLLDSSMTISVIVLASIPYYVAALLFVLVFGYQLDLFPIGGHLPEGVEPGLSLEFFTGALYHAMLPAASFIITGVGIPTLAMRANSISILGSDYLRVARLRGLSDTYIIREYVVPNAILPMYTGLMIAIGFMFGGAVVLEQIFTYPGIGYYMFQALGSRDYPLLMGAFILITTAVVSALIVADLTYSRIDPRVKVN